MCFYKHFSLFNCFRSLSIIFKNLNESNKTTVLCGILFKTSDYGSHIRLLIDDDRNHLNKEKSFRKDIPSFIPN